MSPSITVPTDKPQQEFYLLVQPWNVYVQEAAAFVANGGPNAMWGKSWRKISATSISEAQEIGESKRHADAEAKISIRSFECEAHAFGG